MRTSLSQPGTPICAATGFAVFIRWNTDPIDLISRAGLEGVILIHAHACDETEGFYSRGQIISGIEASR